MLSENSYKIGIASTISLMCLTIFPGLYKLFEIGQGTLNLLILNFSLIIFEINLWILFRKILLVKYGFSELESIIVWVIRLLAILGVLGLLGVSMTHSDFAGYIIIIAIVLIWMKIKIAIRVMKIRDSQIVTIGLLRSYIFSVITLFVFLFVVGASVALNNVFDEQKSFQFPYYVDFVRVIPFYFLLRFIGKEFKIHHQLEA